MCKIQDQLDTILLLNELVKIIKQRVQIVPSHQVLDEELAMDRLALVFEFKYAFRIHSTKAPATIPNGIMVYNPL